MQSPIVRRGLSEEQRLMRESCHQFVDDVVLPFVRDNWQREWSMSPEARLPASILEGAEPIGIRTLVVFDSDGEQIVRVGDLAALCTAALHELQLTVGQDVEYCSTRNGEYFALLDHDRSQTLS